jgi:hypothetical protein
MGQLRTKRLGATADFLGAGGKTLLTINVQSGRDISRYSQFPDQEAEILLFPGTRLKVVDLLDPSPDLHIVQLEEVPVTVELIK